MSGRKSSTGAAMKQTTLASFFKKPSKHAAPAADAPMEDATTKGPGAEVVGRRLKVWWPADEAWYAGGVASYDGERHAIAYDDGDEEAVDLSTEKYELLEGAHVARAVAPAVRRPAPSAGLTANARAAIERKRRRVQADSDEDDDFVVADDVSEEEEEEEEEEDDEGDESEEDVKPKPKKKRRVVAEDPDGDAEMAPVPVSSDKKTSKPSTPNSSKPFDAQGFHDRYRKRSAPVSVDKRDARGDDLEEMGEETKAEGHDAEKRSVLPAGCHTHDVDPKYAFLTTGRKDADGRTPDDPNFNARTLKVDWHNGLVKSLTATQQTWWQVKETHADCVLFYKIGKFYELYHTDADVGVAEAGLVYMKGEQAHAGFPELAYGKYVEVLVSKGFKVCRVEQTETPAETKVRIKGKSLSKLEKGMRREVCSLTTPGTRLYTVLDMRLEKEGGGFEPVSGPTHLAAVCENNGTIGVCVCDSPTGTFTLAQFEDDAQRTRLRTLLAALPPAEILVPRGSKDLAEICERSTGASVERLTPEREFWSSDQCVEYLSICGTFPKSSKQGNSDDVSARWPNVLRTAVRGKADVALSSLGAVAWWLRRALVDVELLSMRRVDAYVPPDLGEAPEVTLGFVAHDEATLIEAALAVTSVEDEDDDWRASLRRKAPRMALDATTLKNLEVLKSSAPDGVSGSLWQLVNNCKTAFGGRLLRDWLARPLLDKRDIDARADAVQELVESPDLYESLAKALKSKGLGDLERLLQQLHTLGADRRATSGDLEQHPDARAILFDKLKFDARRVKQLCAAIAGLERCAIIASSLSTKAPEAQLLKRLVPATGDPKAGGGCFPSLDSKLAPFRQFKLERAMQEGVLEASRGADPAVDAAVDAVKAREDALEDWLKEAKKDYGAVKWKHSAKDRYCVEAAETAFGRGGKLEKLPSGWQQRSKTKKARSFAVPCLKSLIQALEDAEASEKSLKADQMRRLFKQFDESRDRWSCAVKCVATLDALLSLAKASREPGYCRAVLLEGDGPASLQIEAGAHPCLGGDVVPNDMAVGGAAPHLLLLSGPNMGGKSTLLRQACVAAILAQVGCFVKAKRCTLHPVDRVFTRLGASDKILEGQSTFMVELLETAAILKHASERSLVILDELGRGTATFDGAAIAHSVVDHLVKQAKCRALFATHYHDLVRSWSSHDSVQLGHMDCLVRDGGENIVFLYKLAEGCSPKSFGINVARLARLPKRVLDRAAEKSAEFEEALAA